MVRFVAGKLILRALETATGCTRIFMKSLPINNYKQYGFALRKLRIPLPLHLSKVDIPILQRAVEVWKPGIHRSSGSWLPQIFVLDRQCIKLNTSFPLHYPINHAIICNIYIDSDTAPSSKQSVSRLWGEDQIRQGGWPATVGLLAAATAAPAPILPSRSSGII